MSTLSPRCRYLHLTARDLRHVAQPTFDVYWPLADVCRQLFGDDRAAPQWVATAMIEAIAMDWSCTNAWRFDLEGLHVEHVVGIIDGKDCRHFLFAQPTQVGTLFMAHLMEPGSSMERIRLPDFPLPLIFRVGRIDLDRAQLLSLRHGDVLRLMVLAPRVLLDDTALCNFTFDGDTLVIERNHGTEEDRSDHTVQSLQGGSSAEGELLDWDQLTMRCDFVLPMRRYRLAELDQLQAGTVLPMDPCAVSEVEMCVGKQVVAIGELVQIGELVGFEVKRMLVKPGAQSEAEPRSERKRDR